MEYLLELLEIIKWSLPTVVVFLTTFYILKQYFQNETRKRHEDMKLADSQTITPIRLQAFERLVLFLERISPESMIMRLHKPGMTARSLHKELLQTVRSEYEHNIAQQIYVSKSAWELVKTSKDETVKLINISAGKLDENASGMDLSKTLLEISAQLKKLPTEVAIDYLKKEIRMSF